MNAFRKIFPFVGALALLGLAIPAAHAQAGKGASAPKAQIASASASGGKWTCLFRQTVEIAPVSFDVRGQASWVVVYRLKGEIIASQRVSERELEQIKRMPCGDANSEYGGIAIG
jgi:hypothetical protein